MNEPTPSPAPVESLHDRIHAFESAMRQQSDVYALIGDQPLAYALTDSDTCSRLVALGRPEIDEAVAYCTYHLGAPREFWMQHEAIEAAFTQPTVEERRALFEHQIQRPKPLLSLAKKITQRDCARWNGDVNDAACRANLARCFRWAGMQQAVAKELAAHFCEARSNVHPTALETKLRITAVDVAEERATDNAPSDWATRTASPPANTRRYV